MKKYIAPEAEAMILLSAEDCLTISVGDYNNDKQWDNLDFGEF